MSVTTEVGKHIYSVAAAHGKRVQAQCEAKNHALVLEDCDLESATNAIINSTYGCAGMRCMALPVVVVQESIADKFVALLKQKAMAMKVGCAYDPETKLGPVVSEKHKQSICRWIQKGIDEGAELVLDGRDCVVPGFENGFFVGPTILDHVTPEMTVGQREIFGPVTLVKRVKNFEEGIAIMNANPFANGSVIFTQSGYYARQFELLTDGGMVGINVGIPASVRLFPVLGQQGIVFGDQHVLGIDASGSTPEPRPFTSTGMTSILIRKQSTPGKEPSKEHKLLNTRSSGHPPDAATAHLFLRCVTAYTISSPFLADSTPFVRQVWQNTCTTKWGAVQ